MAELLYKKLVKQYRPDLPPALDRLDAGGNLAHSIDFRSVYATVLERWWTLDSRATLGGAFRPVEFLST